MTSADTLSAVALQPPHSFGQVGGIPRRRSIMLAANTVRLLLLAAVPVLHRAGILDMTSLLLLDRRGRRPRPRRTPHRRPHRPGRPCHLGAHGGITVVAVASAAVVIGLVLSPVRRLRDLPVTPA